MKKIISLTMAILFTLLCFALLCSCDKINPIELEGYSKIDEDDLYLIKLITVNPNLMSNNTDKLSDCQTLLDAISTINSGYGSFYLTEVLKTNYFLLCGYENYCHPGWIYGIFRDAFSAEIYDWYKVDNLENIKSEINNASLQYVYIVFECVVKKDIISNTDVDYHRRYYLSLDVNSINTYDIDDMVEDEIIILDDKNMDTSTSFQNRNMYYTKNDLGYDYWFLTTDDEKHYITIKDTQYGILDREMIPLYTYPKSIFNYYPELYEYFEIVDDFNYYYQGDYDYNSIHFTDFCITYRGIDLETLKYVFENNVLGEN